MRLRKAAIMLATMACACGLGFGREVALRIDLSHVVAEIAIDDDYATLPAGPLFRSSL